MGNSKPSPGVSLAELEPELSLQWHPVKNDNLTPLDVRIASSKKVWWLGTCGHEWEASISHRTCSKSGCPFCGGKRLLPGFNDLSTRFPDIAKDWAWELNLPLYPENFTAFSKYSAWWRCSEDHYWRTKISGRTKNKSGCPYCAGRNAFPGFNDLESKFPAIAAQWHPTKNGILKPYEVTSGSGIRVWWTDKCGHEWQTKVCDRVTYQTQCPTCSSNVSSAEREITDDDEKASG